MEPNASPHATSSCPASGPVHVQDLVDHFDMFNREHADNSVELFKYARGQCPVLHSDAYGGHFIVTRYEDVRQVLTDNQTYSSAGAGNIAEEGRGVYRPPIDVDPPLHRDFRTLLDPYFHPRRLAQYEDEVRALARKNMAPWVATGRCDIVNDFATSFVTDVLATVIFGAERSEIFHEASRLNERRGLGDVRDSTAEYKRIMTTFLAQRRAAADDLDDDPVSAIDRGTVAGRPLTEEERVGVLMILFAGGLDTTKIAISNIILEVARHPELEPVLRQPGWERQMFDEFLRHDPPVSAVGRIATVDTELNGRTIKKGDRILVQFQSANRDDAMFSDPDDFDFERQRNPHLSFGLGVHRCIGLHLARLQTRVAISELLAAMTNIRLVDGSRVTRRPGSAPIAQNVHIEFDPVNTREGA
jgi:cytochrome P450